MRIFQILLVGIWAPFAAFAESPPAFPEFSPKFGKPPAEGQARIDVEITAPVASAPPATPNDSVAAPSTAPNVTRFWQEVSPTNRDALKYSDFDLALRLAVSGPSTPSLQDMQVLIQRFHTDFLLAGAQAGVSPALLAAIAYVESAGNPQAISRVGAQGVMQLMPATAERFGVSDAFDPRQNILGGAQYVAWLLAEFEQDPILALSGYNAGENAVKRAGGVPEFEETRKYVPKVLSAYAVAQSFCKTPSVFVTDGCVLRSF